MRLLLRSKKQLPCQNGHRGQAPPLREIMLAHGFNPFEEEWWHFTLAKEPYPDTYFDIPVRK